MKRQEQSIMVILFLILIILFAVIATYFIVKNDFAAETIDILFPAVGAIIFSLYLGVNSVYLNKPEKTKVIIPIATLHELESGKLHSLTKVGFKERKDQVYIRELGLALVDEYPKKNKNHKEILSNIKEIENTERIQRSSLLIQEYIEHSFWRWINYPPQSFDSMEEHLYYGLDGMSGSSTDLLDSTYYDTISIKTNKNYSTFKEQPLQVKLPPTSKITYTDDTYFINTKKSRLTIQFYLRNYNIYSDVRQIRSDFGLKALYGNGVIPKGQSACFRIHDLVVTAESKPFTRFSKVAIKEMEWINQLIKSLENSYSWNVLSERIKNVEFTKK